MPSPSDRPRVGYVLKVYPRFSETFVVNEILAHERAGQDLRIFSLRPPTGGRFHPDLGEVRAPVAYLPAQSVKAADLWAAVRAEACAHGPQAAAGLVADADAVDPRDVHQALTLARAVRDEGIAHLHAHFATTAATVARLAARLAGVTWSLTAHAKDIFHQEVDAGTLRRGLSDAAGTVTVSDFNHRHLRALAPETAQRIHRVYNGLPLGRFPYAEPAGRPPTVVAVGRLVEKKGFADLVEACALLAASGRSLRCRIVGEGPLEADLRRRIADHGLERTVELVGPRTQQEVREEVRLAAVLAAPCVIGSDGNRDGLPTVLLEAMALGTPCVSTDVTGIPEAIRDGDTGLLVAQHAPGDLARALARMLDDEPLRVALAGAARDLVEQRFDVDVNAARLRELLWPAGRSPVLARPSLEAA